MTIEKVEPVETRLSRDSSYSWTRINRFRVLSDDPWEDPKDVVFAAAGGPYTAGGEAELVSVDPERQTWTWGPDNERADQSAELSEIDCQPENIGASRLIWLVTFTYRDWIFERPGQQRRVATKPGETDTPLDEPVVWSGSYFSSEELRTLTDDGAAVVNSAEQPYPEQRLAIDYDTIICEMNVEMVDPLDRQAAVNGLNAQAFWGFAARELKLARWTLVPRYYSVPGTEEHTWETRSYVRQRLEFHVRRGGWDISLPNYGTQTMDAAGNADPKIRYQTVDVHDTDDRTLPGANVLLTGSGAFDSVQTSLGTDNISGPFKFLHEVDFASGVYADLIPQGLPAALGGDA